MKSTSVVLQVGVSMPMGGFQTAVELAKGWKCVVSATDLILKVLQNGSPKIGVRERRSLLHRASPGRKSLTISTTIEILSVLQPNIEYAIDILSNYQSPDQIADLPSDDPIRDYMTSLNRLLRGRFRLIISFDTARVVLEDLATAPLTKPDLPMEWNSEILQTRVWDSDNTSIEATDFKGFFIQVDLQHDEPTYWRLMQENARYIVVSGSGYINEVSARLQVVTSIQKVDDLGIPGLWAR